VGQQIESMGSKTSVCHWANPWDRALVLRANFLPVRRNLVHFHPSFHFSHWGRWSINHVGLLLYAGLFASQAKNPQKRGTES
jgi:hypothetical protein